MPYTLAMFIWLALIFLIGDQIGATYLQSDFRLRITFIGVAGSVVSIAHELIYRRKKLGEFLISLIILVVAVGIGVWMSLAFFDADFSLNFLPILIMAIVAWGGDALFRRKFRKGGSAS